MSAKKPTKRLSPRRAKPPRRVPPRMVCSSCGTQAACRCNAVYVTAGEWARQAIAANPEKSNRAIAAAAGVSVNTVRRARQSTEPFGSVDKRIGLDGRSYSAPRRIEPAVISHNLPDPIQEDCPDCTDHPGRWVWSAQNMLGDLLAMRAYWTREFGPDWTKFEVPPELKALAKLAAPAMKLLLDDINRKR